MLLQVLLKLGGFKLLETQVGVNLKEGPLQGILTGFHSGQEKLLFGLSVKLTVIGAGSFFLKGLSLLKKLSSADTLTVPRRSPKRRKQEMLK
jgi:molybdopterin-guanine dinucleotide biosynthesis protein A